MAYRRGGRETFSRLQDWDRGQTDAERLAVHLLRNEGYESLDPSHPLGGRDGGKDILCKKDDIPLLAAVYFPRGQKEFKEIFKKFKHDFEGVAKNGVKGIVLITNQELTLSERAELSNVGAGKIIVEILHLERIANALDSPSNYGVRLEYLDIEYTKEEILAFHAARDNEYYNKLETLNKRITDVVSTLENHVNNLIGYSTGGDSYGYIELCESCYNPNSFELIFISCGKYPLYNIDIRMHDLDDGINVKNDIYFTIKEIPSSSAIQLKGLINLEGKTMKKYNIFYSARNGFFNQLWRLYKINGKWQSIKRVVDNNDKNKIFFETTNNNIPADMITWE